jgi:hypothetical protein
MEPKLAFLPIPWMPRFYLHIDGTTSSTEDEEGYELSDFAAAREEAVWAARELMAARLRDGKALGLSGSIRITDQCGSTLGIVQFRDALPPDDL